MFTILFSVVSIGSLIGALYTARRKEIKVRHVIVSSAAYGVTLLALAATPNVALAFPIGMAVGWASIIFLTASTAIVQVHSDPTMRGRVLALQAIVFLGSTPIGGPITGWVAERWGPPATFVVCGSVAVIAGVGVLWARSSTVGAASTSTVGSSAVATEGTAARPA